MGASLVRLGDGPTPQWSYLTGGAIARSPVLGSDGLVRVHSTDGYLHLINSDGTRAAEPAPVGPPLGWATPLVDDQNRTWVALADGGLQCVQPDGKSPSRTFYRTRRRFDCTGVIVGEMLYLGAEDHFVHAIRLTADRGDNAWRNGGRTGCPISAPLAVTRRGELLVVSQDDHLYCFGRDGSQLWSLPLPGQVLGSPLVDRDDAIVLAVSQTPRNQPARGVLLSVDGTTRRVRWQFATDEPIEGTPVIGDDGVIYCGDNAGLVYAVDRQGQLVWKAAVGAPIRSAGAILGPGVVGIGAEDGSFVALKCSSQALASEGWPKLHGGV
jgi:outer membrane protein assembly factor BamB